jgi:BarA-like signal transduction histidine kinase
MLLQITDTAEIVRQAGDVKPGDYSGYTFAVVLLVVMLLLTLAALKKLWDENKILQTSAVTRAEKMTESLIMATNAQERAFDKVAEKLERQIERLDHQADLLKEIKTLKS